MFKLPSSFSKLSSKLFKQSHRNASSGTTKTLFERMKEVVPEQQAQFAERFKQVKDKEISKVTVQQAFQGMRGVKGLICETSLLDPNEGIRFRGYTVNDCYEKLPKPSVRGLKGDYPMAESMLWLLLTGEMPTNDEAKQLSEQLTTEPYCVVPKHVRKIIDDLPVHQHPMTQFTTAILAMQTESEFAKAYEESVHKSKYWKYALHDTLKLIAAIPQISARLYRQSFRDGNVAPSDEKLDWSANWCQMIGKENNIEFYDLMRMFFMIHTDHEGGNVSAHTTHLVGSALSDPYLSYAAGMCGLAGPLHGLANQESLRFIQKIQRLLGDQEPDETFIKKFVIDLLESGQVVPGFGHAVLKKTDPRYSIQREFALKHCPNSDMFKIVDLLFRVAPPILAEWKGGKISNPWPNLDAHSGSLLYHYGLTEDHFYTVLFGMSRAFGVLSNYVIDRYMGQPIERPKSMTMEAIANSFGVK